MPTACQFQRELPRGPGAPGEARRALTTWYGVRLGGEDLHTAKLLVSELVTNAVLHGSGRILLRSRLDDTRLLVEVIDEGAGFRHEARRSDLETLRGRGLAIVDAEASRWGIREGAAHVWFELEPPGPRLEPERRPAA